MNPHEIALNDPEFAKKVLLTLKDVHDRLMMVEKLKTELMVSQIQTHAGVFNVELTGDRGEFQAELLALLTKRGVITFEGRWTRGV